MSLGHSPHPPASLHPQPYLHHVDNHTRPPGTTLRPPSVRHSLQVKCYYIEGREADNSCQCDQLSLSHTLSSLLSPSTILTHPFPPPPHPFPSSAPLPFFHLRCPPSLVTYRELLTSIWCNRFVLDCTNLQVVWTFCIFC